MSKGISLFFILFKVLFVDKNMEIFE